MPTFQPRPAAPITADSLRHALLANRTQVLTELYRQSFPPVRRHIGRRGGSAQDAQDVFQDALLVLYEQATGGTLVLTASVSTYLLGISRNLWHHEVRRRARLAPDTLSDDVAAGLADEAEDSAEPAFAVRDYVEQLGEKCKNVLLSFYYFQQPLTQIAERQGYGSVRSATVQKFKCLERLRHAVRGAFQVATSEQ
ncbi:sigma-70 family RNA polymerase sigma factor [Hymenobacter sp. UYCo722]|uniref:RNA polymerase sigma factor n=1 Tax=Hymenobacter sp. UYCo722 TaxID=3156335 RepID=UPI0033928A54